MPRGALPAASAPTPSPGRVDAPLVADDDATPEAREAFANAYPLGRFGRTDDIAGLALPYLG